jgi:hypothetical protein
MVKQLKTELVLTETDVNNLIKKNLEPRINEQVVVDGARFDLQGDRLIANMNITYRDRVPMAVRAEYLLEWQDPNLTLRPQSLKMKGIELPLDMLETIYIGLDLPVSKLISVDNIRFSGNEAVISFRIVSPSERRA